MTNNFAQNQSPFYSEGCSSFYNSSFHDTSLSFPNVVPPVHMKPPKSWFTIESPTVLNKENVGRQTWELMNMYAFSFPIQPSAEQIQGAKQFFESIGYLFPCENCQFHYRQMFYSSFPFHTCTRETLSRWVVDIHNQVNKRLGKPIWNWEQVQSQYVLPESNSCESCNSISKELVHNETSKHEDKTASKYFTNLQIPISNFVYSKWMNTIIGVVVSLFVILFIFLLLSGLVSHFYSKRNEMVFFDTI